MVQTSDSTCIVFYLAIGHKAALLILTILWKKLVCAGVLAGI